MRLQLREFCAARSGDKTDISDVTIFASSSEFYDVLLDQVTVECVANLLGSLNVGGINRYELPNFLALKFVISGALGGGASSSLRADNLGKTMGGTLLRIEVDVDPTLAATAPRPRPPAVPIFNEE